MIRVAMSDKMTSARVIGSLITMDPVPLLKITTFSGILREVSLIHSDKNWNVSE